MENHLCLFGKSPNNKWAIYNLYHWTIALLKLVKVPEVDVIPTCLVGAFKHELLFSISYMGCHPSHWRSHIFQDGEIAPPTSYKFIAMVLSMRPWHRVIFGGGLGAMASPLRFRQVPGACDRVLRLLDDTFRRSHPASEGRNGVDEMATPFLASRVAMEIDLWRSKPAMFLWDLNGLMEMDWWKWIDGNDDDLWDLWLMMVYVPFEGLNGLMMIYWI